MSRKSMEAMNIYLAMMAMQSRKAMMAMEAMKTMKAMKSIMSMGNEDNEGNDDNEGNEDNEGNDESYYSINPRLLQAIRDENWVTILSFRNCFDPSRESSFNQQCDFNVAMRWLTQKKLCIKRLTQNELSWCINDLMKSIIISIETNCADKILNIKEILPISKYINIHGIMLTLEITPRYKQCQKLLKVIEKILYNRNHYMHNSMILLGMLRNLCTQIIKCCNIQILDRELKKRLKDTIKLAKKIYCLIKNYFINHKNIRIIKYMTEMAMTERSKCAYRRCTKKYMQYKFQLSTTEIQYRLKSGQRLKKINKWHICSRCKFALYCSKSCQKKHWNRGLHREQCATI